MECIVRDDAGQIRQVIALESKNFKTGSKGYYGNGKIALNGKRFQGNFMLVEIGSKNNGHKSKKG